mgnify:CR=1 FL=1
MMKKSFLLHIKGLVQGVGFRPFVYRLAHENELTGWVNNQNDSVNIQITGYENSIVKFIEELKNKKPEVSRIESLELTEILSKHPENNFTIIESKDHNHQITQISPDLAVCPQCLEDMKKQSHRLDYPFINCTHCGPRFSIIQDLPYDRIHTTMQDFEMCHTCKSEYTDPLDRRFHAEPIACSDCGPHYTLDNRENCIEDIEDILKNVSELIDNGEIVNIKGIGGYFIACDATSDLAVQQLRSSKKKYGKPFAVMFRDIMALKEYVFINENEEKLITSIKRPIVLLKQRKPLAKGINDGLSQIGVMLPYMPIHYQLFEQLTTPAIVMTSGNISEEPIVIDDVLAKNQLSGISSNILSHNRSIHNRVDDSVAFVMKGKTRMIRRSRGYVPEPVSLWSDCEGIFAAGAELVNCFAIGKGREAILSQHIGDLKNYETFDFYRESFERFQRLFRFKPSLAVCDLHPDYLSTNFAESLELPLVKVQHHHAHIASCMAEHQLDKTVIGVSMDGTGYGTDGKIWGGEFFITDLVKFERWFHFENIPISGGDQAAYQPWRSAVSYLHHYQLLNPAWEWIGKLNQPGLDMVMKSIERKINCPESSGAGRLFDTVAALTGICHTATYHAEAPMKLEALIREGVPGKYSFEISRKTISFRNTLSEILEDLKRNTSTPIISARFHNMVIEVICEICTRIRNESGLNKVVLSGGTFQNRYLLERALKALENQKFEVYTHEKVPSNDGGIALGQLAIAAKKREMRCV